MSSLTFHHIATFPLITGLKNLHAVLQKGLTHALSTDTDPTIYLTASLAPDMFNLRLQIDRAITAATAIAHNIDNSIEGLTFTDAESQSFPQLLERVEKAIAYLETLDAKVFEGREDQEVVMRIRGGKVEIRYSAARYVMLFAHPNFWFHVTTAYDILRHKGVDVGKADFLNGAGIVQVKIIE